MKHISLYEAPAYQQALKATQHFQNIFQYQNQSFFVFKLFKNFVILYSPQKIHPHQLPAILKQGKLKSQQLIYTLSEESTVVQTAPPKAFKEINPRATRLINLQQSLADILKNFHSKGRYNVRLAEKKGVTVQKSTDIKSFYKLWEQTAQRDQFAIHSLAYLQKLFQSLQDQNATQLYLAYHQNKAIAGLLALDTESTRFYLYGASNSQYRSLMAPYLLQWEAIQDGKHKNLKFYDFLGIQNPTDPKKSLVGVSEFKRKFGGEIVYFQKGQIQVINWPIYILLKIRKLLLNK